MVWHEDGKTMVGYCIVTATIYSGPLAGSKPIKEAALWHIYVNDEYRRQGYARTLIEALKATYDTVYTHAMTPEGKKMLMACGFVRDEDKGTLKVFRWRKKSE
jgi:GNAT superfamily N-acetyltransferase